MLVLTETGDALCCHDLVCVHWRVEGLVHLIDFAHEAVSNNILRFLIEPHGTHGHISIDFVVILGLFAFSDAQGIFTLLSHHFVVLYLLIFHIMVHDLLIIFIVDAWVYRTPPSFLF